MKRMLSLAIIFVLLCSLYACGKTEIPEKTQCGHEPYSDLLARLEARDYDGARLLIDIMEGRKEQPTEPSVQSQTTATEGTAGPMETEPVPTETLILPAPPVTEVQLSPEVTVTLSSDNIREYFTFAEEYMISEESGCRQYVMLKEPYQERLVRTEDVRVEVSYLLSNAYGTIDLTEKEFRSDYYDILSGTRETKKLELDINNTGWISSVRYSERKGCFADLAMDVKIESGSGKLILKAK